MLWLYIIKLSVHVFFLITLFFGQTHRHFKDEQQAKSLIRKFYHGHSGIFVLKTKQQENCAIFFFFWRPGQYLFNRYSLGGYQKISDFDTRWRSQHTWKGNQFLDSLDMEFHCRSSRMMLKKRHQIKNSWCRNDDTMVRHGIIWSRDQGKYQQQQNNNT